MLIWILVASAAYDSCLKLTKIETSYVPVNLLSPLADCKFDFTSGQGAWS